MKRISLLLLMVLWFLYPVLSIAAGSPRSSDLLELQVKGIALDPEGQIPVVILEAPATHKAFPMWIGRLEAQAIAIEMEGGSTPRPLTHVLLKNILRDLRVNVQRIVINDVRNQTFYASISLQQGSTVHTIDARPSDAIALALGAKAPIFVTASILETVRTIPLASAKFTHSMAKKFGMHMQDLNAQLAQAFHLPTTDGVLVAYVESGSPAAQHGVRRGDVINGVGEQQIKTVRDILATFANPDLRQLTLRMTRDQMPITIRLRPSSID